MPHGEVTALDTLISLWKRAAQEHPDRVAVIFEERRYTYGELDAMVSSFAAQLMSRCGVTAEDKVALLMPNGAPFVVCYLGILRAGATALPVNVRLKPDETRFILDDAEARVLIVHQSLGNAARVMLPQLSHVRHLIAVDFAADDALAFEEMTQADAPRVSFPEPAPSDVAAIIYTSGTTGRPKGAMITHGNIVFNSYSAEYGLGFRAGDIHLLVVPLFHVTGLNTILPTVIRHASTAVVTSRTNPVDLLRLIDAHRAHTFLGVPTTYVLMTQMATMLPTDLDLSSLRMVGYSGAPMPLETIRKVRQLLPHVDMHNFFGLTETTSITTVLPAQDAMDKADSIGKAVPNVELMIADDAGSPLPTGATGELCIRGGSVFAGYFKRPEATAEAFFDSNWFRSGDLATMDEEGYVRLKGRKKEMMIVAGENVYPIEVENVISSLPQVLEVAAIGVPHHVLGEVVKAIVVLHPGEQLSDRDVKRVCMEKLASFKVPQIVEFRDSLPRNASGKVVKRELA
jgi:long-chain acyl-CoA synthetase